MGKIEEKFKNLKKKGEKALIVYLTAGFPNFEKSIEIMEKMENCGVDFLEIGVPFSDPVADGPVIQFSSYKSLENGMNLKKIFKICKRLQNSLNIPYLLMSYYNPVYKFGLNRFVEVCENCGVSGVIIPDLPFEESHSIRRLLKEREIDFINFITPFTPKKRMKKILSESEGFIYLVSVAGTTGPREKLSSGLLSKIMELKKLSDIPVSVGFGISQEKHVETLRKVADGIIIGSFVIKKIIEENFKIMENKLKRFKEILKKG